MSASGKRLDVIMKTIKETTKQNGAKGVALL